jgi:hypothetical protein
MANEVQAYVTKTFLIDIITRDIGMTEAILELVDNSLDRAVEIFDIDVTRGLTENYRFDKRRKLLEPITINIHLSRNEFIIEDNCGGIDRDDLKNEVFIFGNPKEYEQYNGLSAFGIGMKRAFFKLGKKVELYTRTKKDESAVIWDINQWLELGEAEWDISFSDVNDLSIKYKYKTPGTIIKVEELNEATRLRFGQVDFIKNLRDRLQTGYALFIKSGFRIMLNGTEISQNLPVFAKSDEFGLSVKKIKYNDVDIVLEAGISPIKDRTPRGWYVFCNGRMVLEADKTKETGWGILLPQFHPKYNHFLGFASFKSQNVKSLPWSSSKWGVERDSPVYLYALEEMQIQTEPVINLLDRWKDIRDEDDVSTVALKDLLSDVQEISLFASAQNEMLFEYKPKRPKSDVTRISFLKPKTLVESVKQALGNPKMKNSAVGELTFDYYVERELG